MKKLIAKHIFLLTEQVLGRKTLKNMKELEKVQGYSFSLIQKYQIKKLTNLLDHCYRNVPYYRQIFDMLKVHPEDFKSIDILKALPFLTKKKIKENMDKLKAANYTGRLIRMNTGGSTGEPLIFYIDKGRQAYDKAANLRSRRWWRIDIGDREIVLWGSPVELTKQDKLKNIRDYLTKTKLLSAFDMSEKTMAEYAKIFERYRPKHIFGYPSSIYLFCQFLKRNNINLKDCGIKVVFTTAEVLYDFQRKLIEETFSCRVANGYGGRDGGFIAHECPEGSMHVTEDIIVEIIKDDKPVEVGEAGEIVITHLDAYGMPFIRYRMGDIGRLSNKSCTCGRKSQVLDIVEGRSTDFIITPYGKIMHALSLIYILRDLDGIEQFKIIQERKDCLEIDLVTNSDFSTHAEKLIIDKIKERVGKEVMVNLKIVDIIKSDPSGKFRYVVSKAVNTY